MWHRISRPCRSVATLALAGALTSAACGPSAPAPEVPAAEPPIEATPVPSPESSPPPAAADTSPTGTAEGDAAHVHRALNGGTLVELGDHVAQLELRLDAATGLLTLWVFDGHAEQPIRLTSQTVAVIVDSPAPLANRPLELAAQANTLTGERMGDTSEFAFTHEALRGLDRISGRVVEVTVRGGVFRDVAFGVPAAPVVQ